MQIEGLGGAYLFLSVAIAMSWVGNSNTRSDTKLVTPYSRGMKNAPICVNHFVAQLIK